ncbi:hypothetical protein NEOLEDRAFT_401837 [Neolentinus lepideus HHB14362 ss-1]|uniref:Peptidase C14 caspase domain-containing protein n=1 Tax=Neolentinus lepideus HHB14362 ss-1 TaxID=1314782 RepID=A0A165SAY2_9AGAM|nr:hypothetical protein NEOLEDRAFT_401837 [Neolentinus lepideus HHB14362 ss-1]
MASEPATFFALIVGINDYSDAVFEDGEENLSHAVNDAKRMREFLTKTLDVQEVNIAQIYDKAATRDHILSTFRTHLIENPAIKHGDPVLFYFAGHGAQHIDPQEEESPVSHQNYDGSSPQTDYDEDHILVLEAICPADRCPDSVPDIQDRELGVLLRRLAESKGDNVTVIMDCCHSGSGTRGASSIWSGQRARCLRPLRHTRPVPTALTAESSRYRHADMKYRSLHTHVLLAACRPDEQAWETRHGGWFTSKLLQLLSSHSLPTMTYASLMAKVEKMKVKRTSEEPGDEKDENGEPVMVHTSWWCTQTPQCEGRLKDRLLFDGKCLGADRRLVRLRDKNGRVKVKAGDIHGVTPGTQFLIQKGNLFSSAPDILSKAVATEVEAVASYVELSSPLKGGTAVKDCFARIIHRLEPPYGLAFTSPTCSTRQDIVQAGLQALTEEDSEELDVPLVHSSSEEERLLVTIHEDKMELVRNWPLLIDNYHGSVPMTILSLNSNPGERGVYDLQRICALARFDFYLHHENPAHPYRGRVSAKLYKVRPGRPDRSRNLAEGGVAHLQNDNSTEYALHLENTGGPLYLAVYYFDPSNHAIQEIYKAPAHNPSMGPLKKSLMIGEGPLESPISFFLGEGEDEDTGFVKIFLSERYAEMKMIEQDDDFTPMPSGESKEQNRHTDAEDYRKPGNWDSITLCIKVHRDLESARP